MWRTPQCTCCCSTTRTSFGTASAIRWTLLAPPVRFVTRFSACSSFGREQAIVKEKDASLSIEVALPDATASGGSITLPKVVADFFAYDEESFEKRCGRCGHSNFGGSRFGRRRRPM